MDIENLEKRKAVILSQFKGLNLKEAKKLSRMVEQARDKEFILHYLG
jgi:hypothetical protein